MSSLYHDQAANNKHHYKTHRENNAKNKFVIYVEKKQGGSEPIQESKNEIKQEEISKESKKHLIEKALESYEKSQEKVFEKSEFFQNKERKNIPMNSNNYQKKNRNQRDGNPRSTSYHWTNEEKASLQHGIVKDIPKEKILKEYLKLNFTDVNEKFKDLAKNYSDCFSEEFFVPENNLQAKCNIKDAFSRNTNTGVNNQDNRHYNQNRNVEEIPEWAKNNYDMNDKDFKNFEFKTLDRPERHKKEESPNLNEEKKIEEVTMKEEKKIEIHDNPDHIFYDHIDRMMETKLKTNVPKDDDDDDYELEEIQQAEAPEENEEQKPMWENVGAEEIKSYAKNNVSDWGASLPQDKEVFLQNLQNKSSPIQMNNNNMNKSQPKSSENLMNPAGLFDFGFPQPPFPNMNIIGGPPPNLPPIYTQKFQFSYESFEASFIGIYPPNQDHTTINLFSIFTKKIPNGDINEVVWFYKDPQGDTQGPFSSINMDCWNLDKYFPLHLPIAWNQTIQFVTIEHFKNSPISLINLAQRYGSLAKYIPNFPSMPMPAKNQPSSAKFSSTNINNMNNINSMTNMSNININNIFSKNTNFGPSNMAPLNMNPIGTFNNMNMNTMGNLGPIGNMNNLGNLSNINNMINMSNMNVPPNAKFTNNPVNMKNDDPLMQLLRIVEKNNQINMNFNFNRMSATPNINYNLDTNINNNFHFQQIPQQPNLNQNLMSNLIANNPNLNNINSNNLLNQQNSPNNLNSNNVNMNVPSNINMSPNPNISNVNVPIPETQTPPPQQQQQIPIQSPPQPQQQPPILTNAPGSKINTNNLKMMLGLNNLIGGNEQPISKEKEKEISLDKIREKEMMEKRNAEFPSLSEAMGKP